MPGHQGRCRFLNREISPMLDITEIDGADNLYYGNGVIKNLEEYISNLYGSSAYISAGGSTLCVQAIIWLLKGRKIVASRGAHISFYNICAILGISPVFIGSSRSVEYVDIEKALLSLGRCGAVLYITSPNYYGEVLDIKRIRNICDKFGAMLVVDNAHGAHLKLTKENLHPISNGADICCDSLHKTLPALTGAAVLHTKPGIFKREQVKKAMALFGSSSPSYLIMDSIGLCADWVNEYGASSFAELELKKEQLIKRLKLPFLNTDPAKLTLDCSKLKGGVSNALRVIRAHGIEPEFYNFMFICFIITPFLGKKDWIKLEHVLKGLINLKTTSLYCVKPPEFEFIRALPLNDALKLEYENVELKDAEFRLCGGEIPGVPILGYGEVITKDIINFLDILNLKTLPVIKNRRYM